jgi:hypothetical protein
MLLYVCSIGRRSVDAPRQEKVILRALRSQDRMNSYTFVQSFIRSCQMQSASGGKMFFHRSQKYTDPIISYETAQAVVESYGFEWQTYEYLGIGVSLEIILRSPNPCIFCGAAETAERRVYQDTLERFERNCLWALRCQNCNNVINRYSRYDKNVPAVLEGRLEGSKDEAILRSIKAVGLDIMPTSLQVWPGVRFNSGYPAKAHIIFSCHI